MKSTTFKLVKSTFEAKSKETIAESMSLIGLLQKATSLLSDNGLKSLLIVNSRGIVKFYWKRESLDSEIKLVESIYG